MGEVKLSARGHSGLQEMVVQMADLESNPPGVVLLVPVQSLPLEEDLAINNMVELVDNKLGCIFL